METHPLRSISPPTSIRFQSFVGQADKGIMKAIILLFSFVFVSSCVTSGVKTRAVASEEECNIKNYRYFIHKPGFHKCNLREASLWGAILAGANLRGADLSFASLRGTILVGADLRGAILAGAKLQYADLTNADFKGANLSMAKVTQRQAEYLTKQGVSGFIVVE